MIRVYNAVKEKKAIRTVAGVFFMIILPVLFVTGCWSDLDEISDMLDNKAYNLRDRGPAGGWIFHIVKNGDGTTTYYEAAPVEQEESNIAWGPSGTNENGVDLSSPPELTGIGDGKTNSQYIYETYTGSLSSFPAFQACYNYTGGGYTDWFLPSKDELYMMCWNLHGKNLSNPDVPSGGVGGFADESYWSSSEHDDGMAWRQSFAIDYQGTSSKSSDLRVRAVRAFTY